MLKAQDARRHRRCVRGEVTDWYRKAAEALPTVRPRTSELIRLRLTMAEASNRNIGALVDTGQ